MKLPGIYVEVRGDVTQLRKDMTTARQIVRDSGKGMSDAMNNALSPAQISTGVTKMVKDLGTLQRGAKLTGKEFDLLSVDLGELRKHTGLSEKEFAKLQSRMLQTKATAAADRALNSIAKSANLSGLEMVRLRVKLGDTQGAARQFGQMATSSFNSVSDSIFNMRNMLLAGGVGLGIKYAVGEFSDLDKGLIGVKKTTGITGDELAQLGVDIQALTMVIPNSTEELLGIAQAAGQLGVQGKANILAFTKTVGMMGSATDLAGEEAATTLARMLNVAGESADQVEVLGSVLVALGNNTAATEREIALMGMEVGKATAAFEVSSAEAAAMGAAMKAMGVRAELGGSSVGRAYRAIEASIRAGGDQLKALAKITGQTEEEITRTFATNSTRAFQLFLEGLGKVIRGGGSAAATLEQFDLKGEEVLKVLPTMALRSEMLAKALGIAAAETKNATALTTEAMEAAKSFSAQMTIVGNTIDIAAADIGRELAPAILAASKSFSEFVTENKGEFAEFAEDVGGFIKSLGPAARDIGDLLETTLTGWNSLPEVVQDIGIVGALVGGAKARVAIMLLSTAMGMVQNMRDEAAKLASMSELEKVQDNLANLRAELEAGNEVTNEFFYGGTENIRTQIEALEQVEARLLAEAKTAEITAEVVAEVEQDKAGKIKDVETQLAGFRRSQREAEEKDAEKSAAKQAAKLEKITRDAAKKRWAEREKIITQFRKSEEKLAEKYAKKAEQIDGRAFDYRRKELAAEYRELQKHAKDKAALDIWYAQEQADIDRDQLKQRRDNSKSFLDYLKYNLRYEGEAWKSAQQKQLDQWEQHYDHIEDIVSESGKFITDYASDELWSVLKGQGADFSDFWSGLWDSMTQAASRAIVDMAATAATNKLMELGGYLLGAFDWNDLIDGVFHSGALTIEDDELLAKLQAGEMVVPAEQAEIIRTKMAERGAGGDFFGDLAGAVASGVDGSKATTTDPGKLGTIGQDAAVGALKSAAIGAMLSGVSTYGHVQSVGKAVGIDGAVVNAKAFDLAVDAAMQSFGLGVASNVAAAVVGEMMGISNTTVGDTGISASSLGSAILGAVNMMAGFGLPGFAVAAMSPVVGLLADFALDAMDARNFETMRDSLEDSLGSFAGRQLANRAVAAFSDGLNTGRFNGFSSAELSAMGLAAANEFGASDVRTQAVTQAYMASANWGRWGIQTSSSGGGLGHGSNLSGGDDAPGGGLGHGGDNNGGYGGGEGGAHGLHDGGVVDRLIVPGEDGLAALQFGEGVVPKDTMAKLASFLDGRQAGAASTGPFIIHLHVAGQDVAQAIIPALKEASAQGQIVVHAEGVRAANQ